MNEAFYASPSVNLANHEHVLKSVLFIAGAIYLHNMSQSLSLSLFDPPTIN